MNTLRRILTTASLSVVAAGLASASPICPAASGPGSSGEACSISSLISFTTDGSYTLTLSDFGSLGIPTGATITGATIFFSANETLNTISLANTGGSVQTFDVVSQSNLLQTSTNTANNSDRYTGESLDLFDTGIGPGLAQLPSPEATITLAGNNAGASVVNCPEATPSNACTNVSYTPPPESVNNTDAIYGFSTGTGSLGLFGVTKNLSVADILANYAGSGTFNLTGTTKGLTTFSGGGNNIAFTVTDMANFQAEIDYSYTLPTNTPEPASMLLMGGALVGLGLIGKKRFSRE